MVDTMAEVKSLLKHKIKKLEKQHGYVSTSMLTKKEKDQLRKKNEDIVNRINRIILDQTAMATGSVDISQGPYGANIFGYKRDLGNFSAKKKKKKGLQYSMSSELGLPGYGRGG